MQPLSFEVGCALLGEVLFLFLFLFLYKRDRVPFCAFLKRRLGAEEGGNCCSANFTTTYLKKMSRQLQQVQKQHLLDFGWRRSAQSAHWLRCERLLLFAEFEEKQIRLKALRNRQDLFQEEASWLNYFKSYAYFLRDKKD